MAGFNHRQLPPELWIRILEFAAIVPGQLDTDVQDPFDNPYALPLPYVVSPASAREEFCITQDIRARLALVSRQWNTIVTPYLYQSAYIGTNAALIALASTLRHSQTCGHPIRRLDLMMADFGGLTAQAGEALEALFSCLPDLAILNVCTSARESSYAPRAALCSLRDTCAASLRTFSWDPTSSLRPTMHDMQAMLSSFTGLRTLGRLWWPDCDGYVPGCPYGLPIFPKLKCMSLPPGHDDHGCPPPHLGTLEQIVLGSTVPDGCVDAFVRDHAQRLRIAYIQVVTEEQSLAPLMTCSVLEHLVLYTTPDMVRALSLWHLPASVTHLGVHVGSESGVGCRRELIVLLGHLSSMEAVGLQVVRMLHLTSQELVEFLRTDGFALAYDTLTRKGWTLEDRMGHKLSPPIIKDMC